MRPLLLAFLLPLFSGALNAQEETPRVFVLGENETIYEKLSQEYNQSLLEACQFDMPKAFDQWLKMMQEMEAYAEQINYNLKGVSVWFHVFWNEDGQIDHIGYLLRPQSRNVPTEELSAFLSSFMRRYTFPVTSDKKFAQYTGATFPTFSEKAN